jgi:hypothetical protein
LTLTQQVASIRNKVQRGNNETTASGVMLSNLKRFKMLCAATDQQYHSSG